MGSVIPCSWMWLVRLAHVLSPCMDNFSAKWDAFSAKHDDNRARNSQEEHHMPPSIADLDGKRVIMGAPPGFECMMGCQTCWTEGHWQMSVLAPNKIVHHDPTMCFCCKASPCPCTTCPFYTPLGMRFEYTQDENDPTKWVGSGAICGGKESGCCAKQMHHDGDYFIVRPAVR